MGKRRVILAILFVVFFYLAGLNNHWAVKSDSGLYLALGRSLAEGRGMEFNGKQEWGIPPVVPLLIAGCWLLVGDQYWLINLAMSLFGLGVVVLTYLTAKRLSAGLPEDLRPGLALGVVLIVGTSARLFIDSTRILTDVPFTFFVMLGMYAFVRGRGGYWAWYLLGSAALLLATLTRLPGLFFFGGVFVAVLVEPRREGYAKRLVAMLAGGALLAVGFLLWNHFLRSRSDPGTIDYVQEVSLQQFNLLRPSRWAEIGQALRNFPTALCGSIVGQKLHYFNLLPAAVLLVGVWPMARYKQLRVLFPLLAYVGFLIAYSPAAVAARYFLPVMPLLVYGLLLGIQTLTGWFKKRPALATGAGRRNAVRHGWGIIVVVGICLAISVPKAVREIYWMRYPRFYEVFDGGRWQGYMDLGVHLRRRSQAKTDRVLAPKAAIVHYLSRVPTDTCFQWKNQAIGHFHDLPPAEFAEAAADGPYRFIVVPTDKGGWSEAAMRRLGEKGLFGSPSLFEGLAVYERLPAPSEGGPWPVGPSGSRGTALEVPHLSRRTL
ncbi:MAG: phospholipid carrier-dependent glycosyltransferase [Phycisphaerae bacterium]